MALRELTAEIPANVGVRGIPTFAEPLPPDSAYGPPPTDEDLLEAFYGGDDAALEDLVTRYQWLVYLVMSKLPRQGAARAQKSEDLVQLAWVKVMDTRRRQSARWRAECGLVRPWLLKIVSNCVLDAGRREAAAPPCWGDSADVPDPGQDELFILCERRTDVAQCLRSLDDLESMVVVLMFWAGMRQSAIAEALSLSPATISRNWKSARGKLHAGLVAAGWDGQ